jgi:hypothetical protein
MHAFLIAVVAPLVLACTRLEEPPAQAAAAPSGKETFDHADYDALLKKHVKGDRVDYAALKAGRAALDAYVDRLAKLPREKLEALTRDEQEALWINAYNALTLRSIVDAYPIKGSALSVHPRNSIRQIDDVWEKKHRVASRDVSLDEIEKKILLAEWKDPRLHAAVNCASIGCPPLRAEAFTGARIAAQLDEQTRKWIADPARNFVKPSEKKVEVSKIFDWYRADFGGPTEKEKERGVLDFLIRYGPAEWKPFLEGFDPDDVKHLDYDWSLNDTAG